MNRLFSRKDRRDRTDTPDSLLTGVPVAELEAMRAAGETVVECHRVLAKTGNNIVAELLRDSDHFYEWDHYPEGDVYDFETHGQYYYHAHPQEERPGEHGHFHTFLRPDGMPPGTKPVALDDFRTPADPNDALSHLVAISMNSKGFPIRLFTTNRWVTGETWYAARDVCRFLPLFEIDLARPSWVVNQWIGGMVTLFRPQIRQLVVARDACIESWRQDRPDANVYEDRDLEVTAELDIDLDAQIAAVDAALEHHLR